MISNLKLCRICNGFFRSFASINTLNEYTHVNHFQEDIFLKPVIFQLPRSIIGLNILHGKVSGVILVCMTVPIWLYSTWDCYIFNTYLVNVYLFTWLVLKYVMFLTRDQILNIWRIIQDLFTLFKMKQRLCWNHVPYHHWTYQLIPNQENQFSK